MTRNLYNNSGVILKKSGWVTFIKLGLTNCLLFPIWLCILLPLSILGFVYKKLCVSKKAPQGKVEKIYTEADLTGPVSDRATRKYDVIIYGATGYTGFLSARYLAENYGRGKGLKWAIGGRSLERLEKKKAELAKMYPDTFEGCDCVIADSKSFVQLAKMCNSTKVICSTVGPFTRYGSE